MVRLSDMHEEDARHLLEKDCPQYAPGAWVKPPPLARSRVALVTTAGLQIRADRVFDVKSGEYRVIPGDVAGADLLMSHTSVNFDRTGFQQDVNAVFPVDRFRELEREGVIGSLARFHYSFMAAYLQPEDFESGGREVANLLRQDQVDVAFLIPV